LLVATWANGSRDEAVVLRTGFTEGAVDIGSLSVAGANGSGDEAVVAGTGFAGGSSATANPQAIVNINRAVGN